jgi:hypothetical protein
MSDYIDQFCDALKVMCKAVGTDSSKEDEEHSLFIKKTKILVLLGNLRLLFIKPRQDKETDPSYKPSVVKIMDDITEHVQGVAELQKVWDQIRPIFTQTLL